MLDNTLIEKALALCGKKMEDMEEISYFSKFEDMGYCYFSIKNFCYYLLSPSFIDKYQEIDNDGLPQIWYAKEFGTAIYEYQKVNEEPLISLLSKLNGFKI